MYIRDVHVEVLTSPPVLLHPCAGAAHSMMQVRGGAALAALVCIRRFLLIVCGRKRRELIDLLYRMYK